MKKTAALILCLLLMLTGMAETAGDLIPERSLWGCSRDEVEGELPSGFETCQVGAKKAFRVPGIDVDGYTMDAYYVFGQYAWEADGSTYRGLSKVAYVLSGAENQNFDQVKQNCTKLIGSMEGAIGTADTTEEAVTIWNKEGCKIEIGWGDFKSYTGYSLTTAGIIITGNNLATPIATPEPTVPPTPLPTPSPTPTPTPKPVSQTTSYSQSSGEASNSYVLNTSTKVFHIPGCAAISLMNSENREDYYGTRSSLISKGYSSCGRCHS